MPHLHGYRITGAPIPELLCPGEGPLGEVVIEAAGERELLELRGETTIVRDGAEGPTFWIARRDGRFLVWGKDRGSFEVDAAAMRIRTAAGENREGWAHQLATVALPLLLAERGAAGLHASAIATDAGALVLSGESGRGKSTTAMLASALGYPVLADDALVFTGDARAFAGGSGLWVTPLTAAVAEGRRSDALADGRGARRIHRTPVEGEAGPHAVAAIVSLGERGPELQTRRLEPVEALRKLVPSLLHVGDRVALQRAFMALASVLESVPAWEASLPSGLNPAREAIPDLVRSVSVGAPVG